MSLFVFPELTWDWLVYFQLADKLPERYEGQRKAKANKAVGNLAFPYSLYFVFYEQYAFIQVFSCHVLRCALCNIFYLNSCILSRMGCEPVLSRDA